GNVQILNAPLESRAEKLERREAREGRRKEEARRRAPRNEPGEGKVEAYLRQNQVSIRQQQNRHSAVRQAEHRVNLRSLPLNEVTARGHDRTPTDRHRGFPERESRDYRRERDRDNFDFDGEPLSPIAARAHDKDSSRPVRKSSSAQRVNETTISTDKRRFFCREWVFQKIAYCLEQRAVSKTCGALILGDAGSGKTALCQELSQPGPGPQARQQRALNRRLLARHFLQGPGESAQRPGEFIRSLAMQILSHSAHATRPDREHPAREAAGNRNNSEENLIQRFREMGEDTEDISKPLLGDCEDRTDDDDAGSARRHKTIDRLHERDAYMDLFKYLPEIMPRTSAKATNPFVEDEMRLYENHENLFLRNISQRQSRELRSARLLRQSSEPLAERKPATLQKSLSTETEDRRPENSPPKSRIPVANFKYPNRSELKPAESPKKSAADAAEAEAEYENVLEVERKQEDPPPIPSLPVSQRTLIANAYYEKLLSDGEIQQALLPRNLERAPDECFKRAILFPLLEIDPPKQCLFLLVDAIDEGTDGKSDNESGVGGLLSRHQHLLPHWLLLVATARRHSRHLTKMFTGFRKITLDELQRAHVSADVQRYVLARLDTEPRLRGRVSSDSAAAAAAAAALDHLRIKSDGCLLYLEKVLDGVADGFIALREIREIPGTLNGLYLWLAQRLFHGRRFTKVRLLLDVLLAARCGVTEEMLYKCLLTKEYSVTREDFNRRLHLLRRVLVMERGSGHLRVFHASFAGWLLDVKHCTRRYLCSAPDGHAALAMCYTLLARGLTPLEIHHYVYHMTYLEQHLSSQKKNKNTDDEVLNLHTLILLWVLDSGCDVEAALKRETDIAKRLECDTQNDSKTEEKDGDPESESKESASADPSTLESIMPELVSGEETARWPRDRRVLRALLELSRTDGAREPDGDVLSTDQQVESEEINDATGDEQDDTLLMDPSTVHELASRGDEEALAALLKRCPQLVESRDSTGSTALHAAARSGRAGCAALLLRAGASAAAADGEGWSVLRAAAWAGHSEVVDVLLEHGCDVDCVDADNRTALRAAAWSGHEAVAARLLAGGAAPDRADACGRTALMAAAYMGHADIVRMLLDAGADPDRADEDGRTSLAVAALCGTGAACAALLLERGADAARRDRDNAAPLLVAAFEGHTEICEVLLEAEADIEATDSAGRTALWAAASAGHAATVRLLLFWGACVDTMDAEGRTVLSTAAAQGNVEVVRQLLDRGLDEHHRDNSGWTPLHYAAFEGHIEVCEALLEAGAKVDEADNEGKGPLLLAAQEGHLDLVTLLVDKWNAPVDQRAHDGKTALRLAALEGQFETVAWLVARGAALDALDADRRSTLYVLALDNRLAMARQLLAAGAAVHCCDTEGRTPLHVSAWQGHTEMVNLLIKVGGAAVDGRDRCARTALHAAAWRGRAAALRALLAHGADPAAVCTQGATPLGIAAQEGHEECVLWLLQHGADPLQADHCGRTPAKVAWRAGHANICRLLERWSAPSAPLALTPHAQDDDLLAPLRTGSPEYKRRSVHSSNSTKSSSNLTGGSNRSHEQDDNVDKVAKPAPSLSFAQQVARCGWARRERARGDRPAPAPAPAPARDCDAKLRNSAVFLASRLAYNKFVGGLGRARGKIFKKTKNKRNGIVTNPAMRLVANVRNGLDNAAANIRRTGVALAASASSANPAVKTNAFQWRKETPL
ncbi:ankyrin repeat domain-containing protein 50, partial [Zerene cesonia]|uniref:ankyrin repeat domain-containing protein 50 n=1 Tax=Zerene cesonia TaxID=33412 RepID=UPI0018E5269D